MKAVMRSDELVKKMGELGIADHPPHCRCSRCREYIEWLKSYGEIVCQS